MRSCSACFTIHCLILFNFAAARPDNQFIRIQDGILVTGAEFTRSHGATWTVLVTLDAPPLGERIALALSDWERVMASMNLSLILDNTLEQDQRIDQLFSISRVDQLLSAFESTHGVWLRQQERYQRQRASLELGYVTEEILPHLNCRKF